MYSAAILSQLYFVTWSLLYLFNSGSSCVIALSEFDISVNINFRQLKIFSNKINLTLHDFVGSLQFYCVTLRSAVFWTQLLIVGECLF